MHGGDVPVGCRQNPGVNAGDAQRSTRADRERMRARNAVGQCMHSVRRSEAEVMMRRAPGEFFGATHKSFAVHGVSVTHRVADRAPEEVPTHTHTDAHFILVTGGGYVSVAEGRRADASPVLIFNPPGTTHRDHFVGGRGSFFAISLEPGKVAALRVGLELPQGPVFLSERRQHAMTLSIASCDPADGTPLEIDALVHELLGTMDQRTRPIGVTPPGWLHQAIDLLHDRYAEDLSIADVAGAVGVHSVHLARTFRRHFRCTPGAFARFRRLEKAAHLLTRTHRSLAEIAQECGFGDQSHLTRVFTRALGLPPGEYRRTAGCGGARAQMLQIDKKSAPELVRVGIGRAVTRR